MANRTRWNRNPTCSKGEANRQSGNTNSGAVVSSNGEQGKPDAP